MSSFDEFIHFYRPEPRTGLRRGFMFECLVLKESSRRAISPRIMGAAMIMVGLLVGGGALFMAQASTANPTITVSTNDSQISSLGSEQIQVQIQNGNPSCHTPSRYKSHHPQHPSMPEARPASRSRSRRTQVEAGRLPSPILTLRSATSTFAPSADPAALPPQGQEDPNTEEAGTYGVTASASGIASATATFTVVSLGTVTGTGTLRISPTTSHVFVSAASGGYVSCTGTTTTPDANFPTDSNSGPFLAVQIGTTASTGVTH